MPKKKKIIKKEVDHIRGVWGLLCSMSSIDQQRNNISLFNVIEQFNLPAAFFEQQKKEKRAILFPFNYEVVLSWRRLLNVGISDEEILADLKLKTIDSSGNVLQEMLAPLRFPRGIRILRYRIEMQGLLASTPGNYIHEIEVKLPNQNDFKKVIEIPFEVTEKLSSLKAVL